MMRLVLLATLASVAACDGACYILEGSVACDEDDDCPEDIPFCIDRPIEGDLEKALAGERICSAVGECTTSGDCGDDAPFCTVDPDGDQFCTDFCDDENRCLNDDNEFCFQEECTDQVGCDDDADCGDGEFDLCLIDPRLPLSCVFGDADLSCGAVDDATCVGVGFLCETSVYGFCMDANDAVGSCDAALALSFGEDFMMFVVSMEDAAGCTRTGCVDVSLDVLQRGGQAESALDFAVTSNIQNVAFQEVAGGQVDATTVVVSNYTATGDAARARVTFRAEGDVKPDIIAVSLEDPTGAQTNAACFAR